MRSINKAGVAGGMAVLLSFGLVGVAVAGPWAPSVGAATVAVAPDQGRDADLAYSREQERMAMDLYTLFGQTYDASVFDRIAAGEQRHFDAVGALLTTYGLTDPAAGLPAGTYANAEVQTLYDQWKAQGLESQDAAFAVGIALEQADIADLERLLARNQDADVQQVFTHLLTASRHHLAAFTSNASGARCSGTGDAMGAVNRTGSGDRGTGMGTGQGMGRTDG
jgi:hypothetical protein